jgi:hypothetical protein
MPTTEKLRERLQEIEEYRDQASFDVKGSTFVNGYRQLAIAAIAALTDRDQRIAELRRNVVFRVAGPFEYCPYCGKQIEIVSEEVEDE